MSHRRYDRPVVHIHVNDDAQVVVNDDAEVYIQHHPDDAYDEVEYDREPAEDNDEDDQ